MIYHDLLQGSDEWQQLRAGRFTASRIVDVMAKTKSGYSASRKNYLAELMVERMTGVPTAHFTSPAMQWGTTHEPDARTVYELMTGNDVQQVGLIIPDDMDYVAASPDGLIGDDGGLEIKCPNTATHIETLRTRKIPRNYMLQMQWNMFCSGRSWWDFVSYDPRMRLPKLTSIIIRVDRDDDMIAEAVAEVEKAEGELVALVAEIQELAQ